MPGKPADIPKTPGPKTTARDARAIDRRSFLAAAPAAGLAVGAAAVIGENETPPGSDPDRQLQYRETPHIQAYYRRARY